jgi:hypothetical protein
MSRGSARCVSAEQIVNDTPHMEMFQLITRTCYYRRKRSQNLWARIPLPHREKPRWTRLSYVPNARVWPKQQSCVTRHRFYKSRTVPTSPKCVFKTSILHLRNVDISICHPTVPSDAMAGAPKHTEIRNLQVTPNSTLLLVPCRNNGSDDSFSQEDLLPYDPYRKREPLTKMGFTSKLIY